jgi:nucleoid-associated protein YgaU
MSMRRWAGTAAVMGGVAWALSTAGPGLAELRAVATDPQRVVDTQGTDVLLVGAAGALAWLCWAWAAVGLLLTGLSAVPGSAGRLARLMLAGVLPAGARRAAAVAVGLSLAATAPTAVSVAGPAPAVAAEAQAVQAQTVEAPTVEAPTGGAAAVDRPASTGTGVVPDWPGRPEPGDHVVLRGDCLWDIAADWLARQHPGTPVADPETARAVAAWWQANADVIGPDPDLLLPGQVLRPPA